MAKSLLSAISYCHTELGIVIAALNPESIACQFDGKVFNTRLINFSYQFKGPEIIVSERQLKDRLSLITKIGDHDPVYFEALFMAPEQVNFGLYLYKGDEDDKWQLSEDSDIEFEKEEKKESSIHESIDKNLADYFKGYIEKNPDAVKDA